MRKKLIITSVILILLSAGAYLIFAGSSSEKSYITTSVQRGSFEILVYSTGQLEAQSSENIVVPEVLRDRSVRIYEIKITDLIEEGSVVDSGDYVASLDHKAVEEVLVSAQEDLEQALNSFEDAKMDSNLTLSNYRDQIINAREELEEMQIILDESVYESPAIIRKAEMDVDKAKRKLEQEIKGYDLRERQAISRVERSAIELRRRQERVNLLHEVLQSLRIHAPKQGMLVYGRDRTREKIQVGSNVSAWSPVIATLPDLSSMQSLTWVNEIDISKVKVGQKVILGIDALPDRELEGEVVSVANIGQPMPRSDAKVFEVKIQVFGEVDDLKPAMTTSNIIHTGTWEDTLFIPAETVFKNDSLNYVFLEKNNGFVKQVVDLGDQNENYILVRKGLEENDRLLLNIPDNEEDLAFDGMDIYQEIKERKLKEEEEAAEQDKNKPSAKNNEMEEASNNPTNRIG
ncbi:MAG TPA: HlyD family efflux transporter periplasmic adaptor subunit [Mariniphaga anaerophila]|uniref:HlyD family efflux transporter periplasmic adaptor subunit n=1 Tax=Mariniphaga anaerophila TaxID=1484053 RepID=A0A831LGU0_9BACT|nr:HlyD family efflux transporter periplasmic adaptor subunit [Mariniphaga anaerophila]